MTLSYLCYIMHLCLEIGGYKYWYLLILHGSSFFIYFLSVVVIFCATHVSVDIMLMSHLIIPAYVYNYSALLLYMPR